MPLRPPVQFDNQNVYTHCQTLWGTVSSQLITTGLGNGAAEKCSLKGIFLTKTLKHLVYKKEILGWKLWPNIHKHILKRLQGNSTHTHKYKKPSCFQSVN